MPMPLWWGQINKRVFNPRALRSDRWQVVHHVGRSSGVAYRTPVEAMAVDDGFIITLVYGQRSDWVRNVLEAGSAQVETNGELVEVCDPQILTTDEAFARLPAETKRPPRLLRIGEFLALRRTQPSTTNEESDDPGGLGP
jgi:deazaflavin-dependent oxidoreductase (nitroreductase family)